MIDGFDNKFIHARIRLKLYQMKKYQAQGTIATKTKMKPVTVTNSESISRKEFFTNSEFSASRALQNSFSFDCYARISSSLEFFSI